MFAGLVRALRVVIAGIALVSLASCASTPAAAPAAAEMAATVSHFSRGCPKGGPASDQIVEHAFYTLSNNGTTKFADWAAYVVDPQLIGGPDRPRNWKADPDLDEAVTLEPDDYDNVPDIIAAVVWLPDVLP